MLEDDSVIPQIETLSKGMLRPDVLLDLIKQFTVFEKTESEDENGLKQIQTVKKIAAYHQYYAVNKAVESTKRATAAAHCAREDPVSYGNLPTVKDQPEGDPEGRCGVAHAGIREITFDGFLYGQDRARIE